MFLRVYSYSLLRSVRQKYMIFWTVLFPIILGTLFKVSFGDMNETDYMFQQIPVAYVEGEEPQQEFETLLEELEEEQELIQVIPATTEEAEKMLEDGEVEGIFTNGKEIVLTIKEEGLVVSILNSIQKQYNQIATAFDNISADHPEKLAEVAESLGEEWNYLKESGVTNRNMDSMLDYFYALIAMTCLYGSFSGVNCAIEYKANLSQLAARRVAASTNRLVILLGEVLAKITAQFFCTVIGMCYLRFALDVKIGEEFPRMLLIALMGNAVGVLMGVFVGSIGKLSYNVKESICVCVTMLGSFLAGLMVNGMYYWVEQNVPVINRVNPAALIVKAFYSLNIYENYSRYNLCIFMLLGITVLLGIGSYLLIRRERYASI